MKQAEVMERGEAKITCEKCKKSGDNCAFQLCSACKQNLDRRIYYCSVACQTADWVPRHKAICGKKMTLKAAQSAVGSQPAPTYEYPWLDPLLSGDSIGPADPGYSRSIALIHQIDVINSNEGIDYYLMSPNSSKQPLGVILQDLTVKALFRCSRNDAMGSGDPDAVAAIAQLLMRKQTVFSREEVCTQLSKEYGLDVSAAVAELDRWCAREANGLSKLEFKDIDFNNTTRELLTNSDLKEERDEFFKSIIETLTGQSASDASQRR